MKSYGIITPIVTPMNEDESLNLHALESLVERLINGKIQGLLMAGTNGECYALSSEEKIALFEETIHLVAKRIPVYAGTGAVTTKETIRLSQKAELLGADGLFVLTPYYHHLTQNQLITYFTDVAHSVSIPIFLYNIPGRTGINIDPKTFEVLAKEKNIIGIKDSSGNYQNMLEYLNIAKRNNSVDVLCGIDPFILSGLFSGCSGAVAGSSNVLPVRTEMLYQSFLNGKYEEAKKAQQDLLIMRQAFPFANPNVVVKQVMLKMGLPVGPSRAPWNTNEPGLIDAVSSIVQSFHAQELN